MDNTSLGGRGLSWLRKKAKRKDSEMTDSMKRRLAQLCVVPGLNMTVVGSIMLTEPGIWIMVDLQ